MWRKFTVYGLRFSKTTFWNRINTGFLDPAVATVLTACGIETSPKLLCSYSCRDGRLQQCLPLAVLKPFNTRNFLNRASGVATVLTACGIETNISPEEFNKPKTKVATVLTACGIETQMESNLLYYSIVATVLTACGIETI